MKLLDSITWKDTPKIKAVFSLKNPHYGEENEIFGLNLGYNTSEKHSVTESNKKIWLKSEGFNPDFTATGVQVHDRNVQIVHKPGSYDETDGFVTNEKGLALGIFIADCAAILLYDEKKQIIGACHAGWKGAAADIMSATVSKMKALGSHPNDIEVFVGPCISVNNFEVGEEVATLFPEAFVDRSHKKPHVDLKGFIKQRFIDNGISEDKIEISGECTFGDASRFYSYRRDGTKSGRMMGVIMLRR